MSSVLFVVTGARTWTLTDGTAHPTGYWAEELLVPYRALRDAGHTVSFATPGGVTPVADAGSLGDGDAAAIAAVDGLDAPLVLADVDAAAYDAVYYPGGHGPMQDLAVDEDSAALIAATIAGGRPLAAVCHGVAALLPARTATGEPLIAGRAARSPAGTGRRGRHRGPVERSRGRRRPAHHRAEPAVVRVRRRRAPRRPRLSRRPSCSRAGVSSPAGKRRRSGSGRESAVGCDAFLGRLDERERVGDVLERFPGGAHAEHTAHDRTEVTA